MRNFAALPNRSRQSCQLLIFILFCAFKIVVGYDVEYPFTWYSASFTTSGASQDHWNYTSCMAFQNDIYMGPGMLVNFQNGECYISPSSSEMRWRLPLYPRGVKFVASVFYRPENFPIFRPSGITCCHDQTSNGGLEFGLAGLSWINWAGSSMTYYPCSCATSAFCSNQLNTITEGWFLNGSLVKQFPEAVAVAETTSQEVCTPFLGTNSQLGFYDFKDFETFVRFEANSLNVGVTFPSINNLSIPTSPTMNLGSLIRLGGAKSTSLNSANSAWVASYTGFMAYLPAQCFDNNTASGDGCGDFWVEPLCVCTSDTSQAFRTSSCGCSNDVQLATLAGSALQSIYLISANAEAVVSAAPSESVILEYASKPFFIFSSCPHSGDCFDPRIQHYLVLSINGTSLPAFQPQLLSCTDFVDCFSNGLFAIDLSNQGAPFPFRTELRFVWWSNSNAGAPAGLLSEFGPVVASSPTYILQAFTPQITSSEPDIIISGSDENSAQYGISFFSTIRYPDSVEVWVYQGTEHNTTKPDFVDPLDSYLMSITSSCTHARSGGMQHNCTIQLRAVRFPSNDLFLVVRVSYGGLQSNITRTNIEVSGAAVFGLMPPVIAQDTQMTRLKVSSLNFPNRLRFKIFLADLELLVTEDSLVGNSTYAEFILHNSNRDSQNRLPATGQLKIQVSDNYRSMNFTLCSVFPSPPTLYASPSATYFLENATLLLSGDGFDALNAGANTILLEQNALNSPFCKELELASTQTLRCLLAGGASNQLEVGPIFASAVVYDGRASSKQIIGFNTGTSVFAGLQPPDGVSLLTSPKVTFLLQSKSPFQVPNWHSLTLGQSILASELGLTEDDFYSQFTYRSSENISAYDLDIAFISNAAGSAFNTRNIVTNTSLLALLEGAISNSTDGIFVTSFVSGSEVVDSSWSYLIYKLSSNTRTTPPMLPELAAAKSVVAALWRLPPAALSVHVRYASEGDGFELVFYFKTTIAQQLFMLYRLPANATVTSGPVSQVIEDATGQTFSAQFLRGSAWKTISRVDSSWPWLKFLLQSSSVPTLTLEQVDSVETQLARLFSLSRVDLYVQTSDPFGRKRSNVDMILFFSSTQAQTAFSAANLPYNDQIISSINNIVSNSTSNMFNSTYIGSSVLPPSSSSSSSANIAVISGVVVPIAVVFLIVAIVGGVLFKRRNDQLKRLKAQVEKLPEHLRSLLSIKASDISFGEKLGEGSFGAVFSATLMGDRVAVKRLAVNAVANHVADFFREASTMLAIPPHKNVVRMIGMCRELGNLSMVMEFVPLGSLESYSKQHNFSNGSLSEASFYNLVRGIALGMTHLAQSGIVHRDLAARNVLLDAEMSPKIADFGMARVIGDGQAGATKSAIGPIRWMSPENISSLVFSEKSDVWSFGCLMIELMTGQLPFPGLELLEIAEWVRDNQYTALDFIDPSISVPEWTRKLLEQCFVFQADARPSFSDIVHYLNENAPNGVVIELVGNEEPANL